MSNFHGVVYTKKWVVSLVLDIAGYSTDKQLWKKVIIEPACGQGSFLEEIIDRLLETSKRDGVVDEEHLFNCLRAYDLDKKSVDLSREVVSKKLIKAGLTKDVATRLSNNWIIQDDFLLHETIPADYVVGNPPYLKAGEIPSDKKEEYVNTLSTMTKGCDLFIGFFQKGLQSVKDRNGILCYICADRWMQNQYGRSLRNLISKEYHIDTLVRMHGVNAFEEEVSAYPAITRIDLGKGKIKYADCSGNFFENDVNELKNWLDNAKTDYKCGSFSATFLDQPRKDSIIPLSNSEKVKFIIKCMNEFPSLEESGVKLGIGLATGKDDVYIVDNPNVAEPDRMLPMFNMRDWRKKGNTDSSWLVNPWDKSGRLVNLSEYPLLKSYFEKHQEDISSRHIAKKNTEGWYRTIDKVNWGILGTPMLLFPDMAMKADPVYSDGTRYPCHNCYWLVSDKWDIKVLGGLLMSSVAESFIDALGVKMRGGTKRFQAQYLRLIHVPNPESISEEVANKLRTAFEDNNREAANEVAAILYGFGGNL